MTLADLRDTTPLARWRSLSIDQQEAIGAQLCEWKFAVLVGEDDGTETTEADRDEAQALSDRALDQLHAVIERNFPGVCWAYPDGVFYEVSNSAGEVIGRIEHGSGRYEFVPTSPWRRKRCAPAWAMPFDCVPAWARRQVAQGGRWYVVLPSLDRRAS